MRVLLVEDDYAISQSIETMLKKEGMIVDTTDLGEDGLEIGKLYDYDIIILDLMLPDMNGYEVLKSLRAAKVNTPVLILNFWRVFKPLSAAPKVIPTPLSVPGTSRLIWTRKPLRSAQKPCT